jgi:hypothetical protein
MEDKMELKPGELLLVSFCWEVLRNAGSYKSIELSLHGAEDTLVLYKGTPAGGYEFGEWQPGLLVEDRYALRTPREMAAGPRVLQLRIDQGQPVELAHLDIAKVEHAYTLPEVEVVIDAVFDSTIRLWGYDLNGRHSDESFDITLYWQSLKALDQDYVVFIHLIDPASGEIISQVDEQPRQGERGTSTWLEGEVIADKHTLALPYPLPGGRYALRTGLYIPVTGEYMMVNTARELVLEVEIPEE